MKKLEYGIEFYTTAAKQLKYEFVMPGIVAILDRAYAEDPTGESVSAIMTECRKRMDRLYDLGLYTFAPVKNEKLSKVVKLTAVPVGAASCASQCYAARKVGA